jgi:hypothetical protein
MRIQGIATAFLFSWLAMPTLAQTLTSLTGTVSDPTGAIVPNAAIAIISIATNQSREVQSDNQGVYTFAQVIPGEYKLLAKKAGFADVSIQGIRLLVSTPSTVNITFEAVGTTATMIEVSAEAVSVNTTDATLGNAFGTKPILQLPFEGRNVAKILSLQAGVSWVGDSDTVNGGVSTATDRGGVVNGGRSDQSNITLDGIDVNDQQSRAAFTSVLRVTLDSVQEFRVTTTNANADASRGSGAQVSLVTKSGTNEIHGSAYWYVRNREFNANTFFNNLSGLSTPKLNRNIGGASLGGPVIKNKLFLFGNYEGRRDRFEQSVLRVVPTDTLRQGIASYVARAGNIVQVSPEELASKLSYAPGVNRAALQLFRTAYPSPNDRTAGDGINYSGFRFNAPLNNKYDTYVARLDYVVNDKNTLFVRGQLQDDIENGSPQFPGLAPNYQDLTNSKGIALGWNSTLSTNLISTTRYGLTRQSVETAGIGQYELVTWRVLANPVGLDRSFRRVSPTHHLTQDFTWLKGGHTFQMGGSYRQFSNDRLSYGNSYFGVSSNSSWLSGSGNILSAPWTTGPDNVNINPGGRTQFNDAISMVFGLVTQVTSNYNYLPQNGQVTALARGQGAPRNFVGTESEIYLQDTWRINRQLTLTGGVRYMYWPAIYEKNGAQTSPSIPLSDWFDRRVANANAGLAGQTGLDPISYNLASASGGRPFYDNLHNWSPRLAIAWSPDFKGGLGQMLFGAPGKSVFRMGWGMYYDVFGAGLARAYDASSLGLSTSIQNSSGRLTLADTPRYTGNFDIPPSLITPAPPASFPVTQPNVFQINNSLDDKLRAPYVMRWNVSFQREIKDGWTLTLAYVASEARRTMTSEDLATPLNIRDPQSGQTWYEAARLAINSMKINNKLEIQRPLTDAELRAVPAIPFFENMYPGLAGGGLTATQGAVQLFQDETHPDGTYWLELTDRFSSPSASRLGPFAFYSRQYSYLRAIRSVGFSSYHSMQTSVRKQFRNGDQFDFNWTWAHSFDMGSVSENQQSVTDGLRGIIISPYNRSQMRAQSDFDQRHVWNANYLYNLPFGRGSRYLSSAGKMANLVVGGWQLAGLYRHTTGLPVSVGHNRTWPTNYNITGWATTIGTFQDGTNKNAPPSVTGGTSGANIFQDPKTAIQSFGFTYPGEIGQRNNIRGDGVFNVDMSLAKNFLMPYNEGHRMQFRWEVFNVFNTVRFDPQNINLSLGNLTTFGRYQGTLQPSRVMQLSLRYDF